MNFFIKKNATLPILRIRVSKNGRSDYNRIIESLLSTDVFFSLIDVENGFPYLVNKQVSEIVDIPANGSSPSEVLILIQFSHRETKKIGKYKLNISFRDFKGLVTLPLNEDIYVFITDSFIVDDLKYSDNYVLDYICCS